MTTRLPISLVGLPGVGKSTIGRALSRRLGFEFVDCDAAIERRLGQPIRDYFATAGEPAFRDVEESVIGELLACADTVIATGGGAVVRSANRTHLRERSTCIYLQASPEHLVHRVRADTARPLMQGHDPLTRLRALHEERDPWYRETATWSLVTTGRRREAVVDAIVGHLGVGIAAAARSST